MRRLGVGSNKGRVRRSGDVRAVETPLINQRCASTGDCGKRGITAHRHRLALGLRGEVRRQKCLRADKFKIETDVTAAGAGLVNFNSDLVLSRHEVAGIHR